MDDVDTAPAVVNLTDDNDDLPVAHDDALANPEEVVLDEENEAPELATIDGELERTGNEENGENGEINENGENGGSDNSEKLLDEDNPFGDDEDSDEEGGGVQVTIRKLEPTEKPAPRQGKLDLDSTAMINDKPIYDLDLAQMEDRPWRKPGADITDYFNYGFTEETWNLYCERQKKLRAEFCGNQQAANNALFSSIKLSNPLANPVMNTTSSVVKVLTDNGGRFKPPINPQNSAPPSQNDQIIRTVISGTTQSPSIGGGMQPSSLMDFTRPPPGMSMPPMGMQPPMSSAPPTVSDAPPGVDSGSDHPPGVESAPGAGTTSLVGGLDMHLGIPPLGFNPNLPPPGMPPMGLMSTNLPPPGFNMPPPQFQQHSRAGFGPGPGGIGQPGQPPRSLMSSGSFPQREISDDDEERRSSRRKRSRSRSPRRDRDRDRDRDSRRRGDRDSDRTSSRRHRSRSASGDRRRRRDDRERDRDRDREKRRERRDDDDRKKRSRRDDDDDRREKKEKSSRSRAIEEDENPTGEVEPAAPAAAASTGEESPIVE